MDSVGFIKNIKENTGLLINFFDSTLALYNLIGKYDGLEVINETSTAQIRFIVNGERDNLDFVLQNINGLYVSGCVSFLCEAYMEGNSMIIILKQV